MPSEPLSLEREIRLERYRPEYRSAWDSLVSRSKNACFLFRREYMEYHSDRFVDASMMVYAGETLVALLPANRSGASLISHGGLTFGGFLYTENMRTSMMLDVFDALIAFAGEQGVVEIRYKAIPHIYHAIPAEEDLYALFRKGGILVRRDVSSAIQLDRFQPRLTKGRKWALSKGRRLGIQVGPSRDYSGFMSLVAENLASKYHTKPTHSDAEIALLATRFPEHIQLYTAELNGELLAGALMYESVHTAHVQYLAASVQGRELFGMDVLLDDLINTRFRHKAFFEFGISTEQDGRYLNEGLINYKESFGARAICYDTYVITC